MYNQCMNHSTRDEIEQFLSAHGNATVLELSNALNLTRADIRYNLKKMVSERLVLEFRPNTHAGRGRPAKRFFLNPTHKPGNYVELTEVFLRLFGANPTLKNQVAQALVESGDHEKAGSSIAKLNNLVKFLNLRNYNARWEAHLHGPEVIIRNCPYHALISQHPFLCEMDTQLIIKLSDSKVLHLKSWVADQSCVFRLKIEP